MTFVKISQNFYQTSLKILVCLSDFSPQFMACMGCQALIRKNIIFVYLKIFFTFTNSIDPEEMQHNAAFLLGLHSLQKYSLRGFPNRKC